MSNMVRTAKYEYYNFLPMFLWEEFNPATKIANVYFLFIAALQASLRTYNNGPTPAPVLQAFHHFPVQLFTRVDCMDHHIKHSRLSATNDKPGRNSMHMSFVLLNNERTGGGESKTSSTRVSLSVTPYKRPCQQHSTQSQHHYYCWAKPQLKILLILHLALSQWKALRASQLATLYVLPLSKCTYFFLLLCCFGPVLIPLSCRLLLAFR